MLDFAILGFLAETPLHGYELRKRVAALTGHVRPIADGTLYPAIKRLERNGLITREVRAGSVAAPRHVLSLTDEGRAELRQRLAHPEQAYLTDENRWFTLLAFLAQLDDPVAQAAVLERRLAFLTEPASFFWREERPLRESDFPDDRFRQGLFRIATTTSRTEIAWLRETLAELRPRDGKSG